jgi:hypothetical protein
MSEIWVHVFDGKKLGSAPLILVTKLDENGQLMLKIITKENLDSLIKDGWIVVTPERPANVE